MHQTRYPIHEVFASIQGEGAFVGEPQVFVRVEGCPLRCAWCDTPGTWTLPAEDARPAQDSPGLGRAWSTANEIAATVEASDPGGALPVSLTGGEPLMWPGLIRELREHLPTRRLHLETAGAFPESLEAVLDCVDHVSADHKLPADLRDPVALRTPANQEPAPRDSASWRACRAAVLPLLEGRDACAKLVVAGGREVGDYDEILGDHRELAPSLPLFIQPATPTRSVSAPLSDLIQELSRRALALGLSARVIPQLHVQLGLR